MNYFREILTLKSKSHITSNALLLCENAHNHQIFRKEKKSNLAAHIKILTAALSGRKCKRMALAHLLVLLPQCSKDDLSTYGDQWIRDCSQILKVREDVTLTPALLTVIRVVLKCCHNNQELFNKVSKLNGNFLLQIYSVDSEFSEPSCLCLFEFLHLFPVQALPHKNAVETMLMSFLHLPLSAIVQAKVSCAARCFAILPVPGQMADIGHVKRGKLDQLMALAHCAIDELFKDIQENEVYEFPRLHKLPLQTLDSVSEMDHLHQLLMAACITGHSLTFIRVFLETTSTEVRPRELVRLALRVLQVQLNLGKASATIESLALAFMLPSIHASAIQLLQGFIASNVCEPFLRFVEEQLVATLIATCNQMDKKMHKNNLLIRSFCYETLAQLIQVSGGICVASLKTLMPRLMKDTLPSKNSIVLRNVSRGGCLGVWIAKKKSKKKGYTISAQGSATDDAQEDALPDGANDFIPTAVAALNLMEALFIHAQHAVTGEVNRMLQEHLWALLALPRHGVFADPRILLGLYGTLLAYALHPHALSPPPYTLIHRALEEGARDPNLSVSEVCNRGLAALSFVMANPSMTSWVDTAWQMAAVPKSVAAAAAETEETKESAARGESVEGSESEMSGDESAEESEAVTEDEDEEENEPYLSTLRLHEVVETGKETYDNEKREIANEIAVYESENTEIVGKDKIADQHRDEKSTDQIVLKQNENEIPSSESEEDDSEARMSSWKEKRKHCSEGGKKLNEFVSEPGVVLRLEKKRKITEDGAANRKKIRQYHKNACSSPSVAEMLASFIDVDPDSE